MTTPKHPTALPDDVARVLVDMAREHGYGIERLTLNWVTKDLDPPATARVEYSSRSAQCDSVPVVSLRIEDPELYRQIKAMKADVDQNGSLFGFGKAPPSK